MDLVLRDTQLKNSGDERIETLRKNYNTALSIVLSGRQRVCMKIVNNPTSKVERNRTISRDCTQIVSEIWLALPSKDTFFDSDVSCLFSEAGMQHVWSTEISEVLEGVLTARGKRKADFKYIYFGQHRCEGSTSYCKVY